MSELSLAAIEKTAQALVVIIIVLLLRPVGRLIVTRQLTFFKVYSSNVLLMVLDWVMELARDDTRIRVRMPYVVSLCCYTSAIAVLFASPHGRMQSVLVELVFVMFYVVGAAIHLTFRDDTIKSLRHFFFVPFALMLIVALILATELNLGMARFSDSLTNAYTCLASIPSALAFLFAIVICFFLFAATHTESRSWLGLVDEVSEVTMLILPLFFFFNGGGDVSWLAAVAWGLKCTLLLIIFDVFKTFFPVFGFRQPELALMKLIFPVTSLLFVLLWASKGETL